VQRWSQARGLFRFTRDRVSECSGVRHAVVESVPVRPQVSA
jgi:hypothetical protein